MAWQKDQEERFQELAAKIGNLSPQEYVEICRLLQERILFKNGGKLHPDSSELIREMREERDLRNIGH